MAATASTTRAKITSGDKSLTDSPTNLKEAIDWILRITNQDGLENGSSTGNSGGGGSGAAAGNTDKKVCICHLAEAVRDLFRNVEQQLEPWENKLVDDIVSQIRDVGGTHHLKELIYRLGYDLGKFVRGTSDGTGSKPNGIIKENGYTSHYKKESSLKSVSKKASDLIICARILMGAIPLVFSGLSYLYWWSVRGTVSSDTVTTESQLLCHFMKRCGYDTGKLENHQGKKLHELIQNCNILGNKTLNGQGTTTDDTKDKSFAQYLEEVRTNMDKSQLAENALIKLNILCAGYFRSLHRPQDLHSRNPRTPRTVREILYWLTSLPYCPVYRVLIKKVKELCNRVGTKGAITFYSGSNKSCKIDTENCTTFLLAGALAAPLVLLSIQDTIESLVGSSNTVVKLPQGNTTRIDIHDMYANYLFKFSYPVTETQSYYVLQDCLVALYFQLYFLKQQCNWNRKDGFEWTPCSYGADVSCDGCGSWICTGGGTGQYAGKVSSHRNECGQKNKPSPLQAFLTDCLPGFTCSKVKGFMETYKEKLKDISGYLSCYPPFTEHLGHPTVPGTECAVPMGFSGSFRSRGAAAPGGTGTAGSAVGGKGGSGAGAPMDGLSLNAILDAYANDDLRDSCLYQITRCICSLTRRVPRSTGTLYGFFYGLVDVYSGKQSSKFKPKLLGELNCCPGWRNPECLMEALRLWRGGSHNRESSGKHDKGTLDSLNNCNDKNATCGKYLHPISGSLYNSVATVYTDTYLSWILYLTWRLQDGLKALRDAFRNINCKEAGCKGTGGKDCECTAEKGCTKGTHGTTPSTSGGTGKGCCCENIVKCAGVLGLFYRFGFSMHSPGGLSNDKKRQCKDFYQHLEKVIGGEYYKQLTEQLRKFIYTTRALFGVYIGVYWTAVLVYLLWSITGPLDLLHIQSHWRSPGSYLVPLQRILADGSRNVKRVCTIGYFQEGTGDRLLSLGVSDVYL
ncbi:variant erythrocyte surface antigen-1 family protein protein, putative [Babesia ovis]|uniref:Variant erythrocyte surface antigen-1 family protein protein, putative n=1 Tax=Babesia ovis TaxID=5869 RepID=A0A9W5WTE6_BABOV|nr:variant erythrocyte surface antigen-1 family protein protein, putative [Babesia ovis]